MASPDSIGSEQPKTVADYQEMVDNLKQEKDETKIKTTLNSIYTAGEQARADILADDKVESDELKTLNSWISLINSATSRVYNSARDVYHKCCDIIDSLKTLRTKLCNLYQQNSDEPGQTDSQVMSAQEWLDSVPASVADAYLRICCDESKRGHGGALPTAQESDSSKLIGLQGLLRDCTKKGELTEPQERFLKREIEIFEQLVQANKNDTEKFLRERADAQVKKS